MFIRFFCFLFGVDVFFWGMLRSFLLLWVLVDGFVVVFKVVFVDVGKGEGCLGGVVIFLSGVCVMGFK